jgi:phage terminase small subunit
VKTRDEVIAALVAAGSKRDVAAQYADAYVEYHEASKNIREQGAMVLHPRTNNPIENPYLVIRDRALGKLQKMKVRAESLW